MVTQKQTAKVDGTTKNATLKLLKYDLKWTYKILAPLYLAVITCVIIGRILNPMSHSTLISTLSVIFLSATIGLMINSYINTIARSWARFARNLYGDESYLTHTLPVSSHSIFRAKTLAAVITLLTTLGVIALGIPICLGWFYGNLEQFGIFKTSVQIAAENLSFPVVVFVLFIVFIVLIQAMMMVLCGYAGIVAGHRFNKRKSSVSALIGISLYCGSQILAILTLLALSVFEPDVLELVSRGRVPSYETLRFVLIAIVGLYTVYTAILYCLGQKLLARGVNVD